MNVALDLVRQRAVTADEALARYKRGDRVERYQCPNPKCKAPVVLCAGEYKDAYFAHKAYTAAQNCEEYYAGQGIGNHPNDGSTVDAVDERDQSRRPGIELDVSLQSNTWAMKFRLPRIDLEDGTLSLQLAPGDVRTIPTRALRLSDRRFDVVPCDKSIGIIHESAMPEEYYRAFNPRKFRLKQDHFNVFHAAGLKYQRAVGKQLYWGSSYFFIWRNGAALRFPAVLDSPRPYVPKHGWNCALVSLPSNKNASIARWLEATTELTVASRNAAISVIAPLLSVVEDNSHIEIYSDGPLLVSVGRSSIDMLADQFSVESRMGEMVLDLVGQERVIVRIDRRDIEYLFVRYGIEPGILIHFASELPRLVNTNIIVRGRLPDGHVASAPLYSLRTKKLLSDARCGMLHSIELLGTSAIGHILTAKVASSSWLDLTVAQYEGEEPGHIPNASSELSRLVSHSSSDLIVDFGGYGFQIVSGLRSNPSSAGLSNSCRERILWLLSEARCDASNRSEVTYTASADTDEDLINTFVATAFADRLVGHVRAVRSELGI